MDFESQLRLERDEVAARAALEAAGGQLVRRPDDPIGLYWAVFQPKEPETKPFVARIHWTTYPGQQPSVLFALAIGGDTTSPAAWPAAPGYRAGVDICKPFTAESRTVHPEWLNGPHKWREEGNPFLYVVETIQADIDRAHGARAA